MTTVWEWLIILVGYWSYWVKEVSTEAWGYSTNGLAGRELTDGCWDGLGIRY